MGGGGTRQFQIVNVVCKIFLTFSAPAAYLQNQHPNHDQSVDMLNHYKFTV